MKADALSPRQLFDGNVHYEVPAFQRPYVWNEEDQWAPLWADVVTVALAWGSGNNIPMSGRSVWIVTVTVACAGSPMCAPRDSVSVAPGIVRATTARARTPLGSTLDSRAASRAVWTNSRYWRPATIDCRISNTNKTNTGNNIATSTVACPR